MPITIQIPQPMRETTGNAADVAVTGATVHAALQNLVALHPAIGPKLFDNGKLRAYVNIYLNDEDIRFLDDLDSAVQEGDSIALIPAVAGG
jgi:sulfur-carrier protein